MELVASLIASGGGVAASFVLGALFGSFANVCVYRWPPTDEHPEGRSVVSPGSHCFSCGSAVRWYDNVPLLSFLWLRGRCRSCGATFSARYLLVELVTAALFALAFYDQVVAAGSAVDILLRLHRFGIVAAFCFTLVVITFIDLDHKLILNKVTYPAIPIFFLLGWSLPGIGWQRGAIGAAVGYLAIRLVSDGYYYATGREGLGYGDGKLLAIVGALFGWQAVFFSLFVGSLIGSIVSIAVLSFSQRSPTSSGVDAIENADEVDVAVAEGDVAASGEDSGEDEAPPMRHIEVPFGPFLAAGALIYTFAFPWLQSRFFLFWADLRLL